MRVDERSAAFLALGLAKASRAPVAVVCTSGTAAAHFHAAVIEADESAVPLLVLTADRPPELRGTGANQAIDQIKLYGSAVRWFCEVGVPEGPAPAMARYWRSLAGRAWAQAAGTGGGQRRAGAPQRGVPRPAGARRPGRRRCWDPGRPGGRRAVDAVRRRPRGRAAALDLPWTERGVIVGGDGGYDPAPLAGLAAGGRLAAAGRAVLAGPGRGARPCRRVPVPAGVPGVPGRRTGPT